MLVFQTSWKRGFALGVGALALNETMASLFGMDAVAVGDLLVFATAIALGPWAGMIASLTASSAELVILGSLSTTLQSLFVVGSIGYFVERYPRLPSYGAALGAWLILISTLAVLSSFLSPSSFDVSALMFAAVQDVSMVLIAGTFLLSSDSWGVLASRPRRVNAEYMMLHLAPLFATVLFALALFVTTDSVGRDAFQVFSESSPANLLLALLTCFALVPLWAWKFVPLLQDSEHKERSPLFAKPLETESEFENNLETSLWMNAPEATPEDKAVVVLNDRGQISYANEFFREMAEVHTGQILGKNLADIRMNEDFRESLSSWLAQTIELGPGCTEFMIRDGKQLRFFQVCSSHARGEEAGALPHSKGPGPIILSMNEISEKRTVEEQLLQAQRLRSLGTAVSGIAHSFNNFLTAIAGHASMANLSDSDTAQREALQEIVRLSETAGKLVWKLLDFAERQEEFRRVVDVSTELADRMEMLRSFAGEVHEVRFHPPKEDVFIECDFPLIVQAVSHLILNSRDAYPDGESGAVDITLDTEEISREASHLHPGSHPGNFARIRVKDSGVGMTSDIMQRAFDPMYSTKSSHGNSGLGLSIAFAIVRSHGGFMSLESTPGKGTSVSLYLPLSEGAKEEGASKQGDSQNPRNGHDSEKNSNYNVLVVEDEPSVRKLVEKMVASLGYEVESCEDGESAIKRCKEQSVDLVLVDMMMPKMGGIELCEELQKVDSSVRMVVMTGQVVPVESFDSHEVLAKPFDLETLAERLQEQLVAPKQPATEKSMH